MGRGVRSRGRDRGGLAQKCKTAIYGPPLCASINWGEVSRKRELRATQRAEERERERKGLERAC